MYDDIVKIKRSRKGMIQVYTGEGKGKTTAALGLAFRALGQGKRVLLIQFMKQGGDLGEVKAAGRFSRFKILQAGRKGWVKKSDPSSTDRQLAQKGLQAAASAIQSGRYDLIVLDELNVAIDFGLITIGQAKEILKHRPNNLELIITGRDAHPAMLKIADLVSEIRNRKHYYKKGVLARAGIEH